MSFTMKFDGTRSPASLTVVNSPPSILWLGMPGSIDKYIRVNREFIYETREPESTRSKFKIISARVPGLHIKISRKTHQSRSRVPSIKYVRVNREIIYETREPESTSSKFKTYPVRVPGLQISRATYLKQACRPILVSNIH